MMSRPVSFVAMSLSTVCLLLGLVMVAPPAVCQAQPQTALARPLSADTLADAWEKELTRHPLPQLVDHAYLQSWLKAKVDKHKGLFIMEELGRSVEGRSINHVWFGHGPMHLLLWSQMHGDESTATSALLGIMEYVAAHQAEPEVKRLLDRLTLHFVPMLNPDGAERFQRRNAQGIDINRDALLLQTPEGRLLKGLRDRVNPALGFNLHNQGWRTSVGAPPQPASISLLAVAFDEARSDSPGRQLAKKTCSVLRDTLDLFIPGRVGRYDDEFEVRAFGDNITKWGTPVVLIETGPAPGDRADLDLVRLNFVSILVALDSLASGAVQQADIRRYEQLPMNESDIFTVLIRGAAIVVGRGIAPFTGDIGLSSSRIVRRPTDVSLDKEAVQVLRVEDLGDLRVFGAVETIDAAGLFAVAGTKWAEGEQVEVADWTTFTGATAVAPGVASDVALLKETGKGRYRVERVIPAQRVLGRASSVERR